MTDVANKLWGFCHTLRHDGIDYGDYIEQITYLLFLKMADEKELSLPKGTDWGHLRQHSGIDLSDAYVDALRTLGKQSGLLGDIYSGAQSRFSNPVNLKKLISLIDETEWTDLDVDVKAAAFEGLLEKAASEGKKGAGQYFTPRLLIQAIVRCMKPDPRIGHDFKVGDPACGTGGFLVCAYEWLLQETKGSLDRTIARRIRSATYYGDDLVARPRRLALMNLYLHQVEPHISGNDSIYDPPRSERFDVILTNPPFGTQGAHHAPTRDDFVIETSNKQLNFIQHVMTILKPGGRAAVVVPDNVLFSDQAGDVFKVLMEDCDLHTVLRLPRGTFSPYSPGTKTNVIFFTKGRPTERLWIYDARANVPAVTKKNRPLSTSHFAEFEICYGSDPLGRGHRIRELSRDDRWRDFSIDQVKDCQYNIDSLKWLRDEESVADSGAAGPEDLIGQAIDGMRLSVQALAELQDLLDSSGNGTSSGLPSGWSLSTVEETAPPRSIAYGVLKPGPNTDGGVPMLRVKDLHHGSIDQTELYHISRRLDEEFKRTRLEGGEVVLSIQGSVGRAAIVPASLKGANVSRTLAVIRPRTPELADWLWMWFHSSDGQEAIQGAVGGTTRDSLNLRDLRLLTLPLPPPGQARRIHDLVTQLFSKVDEATLQLETALTRLVEPSQRSASQVARLKQAILAKAIHGELVVEAEGEQ